MKLYRSNGLVNRRLNFVPYVMYVLGSASIRLITLASIITFIIQRRHLLISLIALEGVILTLVLLFISLSCESDIFILFVLLTMGGCEARLGLACLVCIIRSYGRDRFSTIRIQKC